MEAATVQSLTPVMMAESRRRSEWTRARSLEAMGASRQQMWERRDMDAPRGLKAFLYTLPILNRRQQS